MNDLMLSRPKGAAQPKGFNYILAILVWEYFSYYGMRGLLILYLTSFLGWADPKAYALYAAYTAMVYLTPIVGGVIADRFLGFRYCVALGGALMVAGHLVLGLSSSMSSLLYLALSLIICGYGLFKSNISCLLGTLYKPDDERRDAGFSLMYVGGNIGGIVSSIACGAVAQIYGWHMGFSLAAFGMAAGLVIFLSGQHHFTGISTIQKKWLKAQFAGIPLSYWLCFGLVFEIIFMALILKMQWDAYLLGFVTLASAIFVFRLYQQLSSDNRRKLNVIMAFMLFSILAWAFDQQLGSSINLFIDRNINLNLLGMTIPTESLQGVNSAAVLIGGVIMAWAWKKIESKGIDPNPLFKLGIGMLLLSIAFFLFRYSAENASIDGKTTMLWVVLGMAFTGVSELFIDPIALSAITRINLAGATGTLAGIYMLASGSLGNFAAGKIAALSANKEPLSSTTGLQEQALLFYHMFSQVMLMALVATIVLIAISILFHKKASI